MVAMAHGIEKAGAGRGRKSMKVENLNEEACERIQRYLDSYLSNDLSIEASFEIMAHLEGCKACFAFFGNNHYPMASVQC